MTLKKLKRLIDMLDEHNALGGELHSDFSGELKLSFSGQPPYGVHSWLTRYGFVLVDTLYIYRPRR